MINGKQLEGFSNYNYGKSFEIKRKKNLTYDKHMIVLSQFRSRKVFDHTESQIIFSLQFMCYII